jgi:hypothetical protein
MGLNARARERIEAAFARAAAHGHSAMDMANVRSGTPGSSRGWVAFCSCGWQATPRGRKAVAASAAYFHVLEVGQVLDERGRLDGVEWSAAPATPTLHSKGAEAAVEARHAAS